MKERFLVTGAHGFIGSHIVDALVAKGKQVRVFIRENSNTTNIKRHIQKRTVEVVYGDLRDALALKYALSDCTVICNSAAITDLSASKKDLFDINVRSLRTILALASKQAILRFVQISSIGVFDVYHDIVNEDTPQNPINDYERSKMEGEKIAFSFYRKKGVPVTILEPSAVYGPRVRIGFPYMLELIKKRQMRYPVNENNLLNVLYVTDLVKAVELATEKERAIGERFIIGGKKSYSYREIIETAARELGVHPPQKHIPLGIAKAYTFVKQTMAKIQGRKPDITTAYFDYITADMKLDITKAKTVLGFEPGVDLKEGMKAMVEWFLGKSPSGRI